MTAFDIIVLLVLGTSAIGGFMRGFVQEVLSLAAWASAILAIRFFHTDATALLVDTVGSTSGAAVLAFLILLAVPYGIVKAIANRAGKGTRASVLAPVDRILGFGFGAVKGVVVVVMAFSVLVLGYDSIWGPEGRPEWLVTSRTYPFVNASADAMVQLLRERQAYLTDQDEALTDPAP
jgi:membrane protein required for colicin V production